VLDDVARVFDHHPTLGRARKAGSKDPMMGVGDSIRFTTSSIRSPASRDIENKHWNQV